MYCDTGWEVLKNERYNIRGYEGLNICWFYDYAPEAWKKSLVDKGVRAFVDGRDSEGGDFERFPWLGTFLPNRTKAIQLSVAQVNLLSNLTAWSIVETAPEVGVTLGLPTPP